MNFCNYYNEIDLLSLLSISLTSVIAVCAIIALIFQRQHFKRSVIPCIIVGYGDFENRLYVEIRNKGIGPAKINKITVYRDFPTLIERSLLIEWLPKKLNNTCIYRFYASMFQEFYLGKDDIYKLVDIEINDNKRAGIKEREKIRSILRNLNIKVNYSDIYNRDFTLIKDLRYFGRDDNVN